MAKPHEKMSTEDFDRILFDLVGEDSASNLLGIPGVYEIVAEHYHNEVLEAYDLEQEETEEAETE